MPYLVITILLTIPKIVLYILWLLCNCQSVLNPITFFIAAPQPSSQTIILFPVSMSLFYLFYFLDSTYKENCVVFVFFCLILLSIIRPRSTHVVVNVKISFFDSIFYVILEKAKLWGQRRTLGVRIENRGRG